MERHAMKSEILLEKPDAGRWMVVVLAALMGVQTRADLSANAYVTNGLVALFDGIENVGLGVPHDPSATAWADLTGHGNDGTMGANVTWAANGWSNVKDGYPVTVGAGLAAVTGTKTFTLEFAVCPSRSTFRQAFFGQYDGASGFSLEQNAGGVSSGVVRVFASNNPNWMSSLVVAKDEDASVALAFTPEFQVLYRNGAEAEVRNGPATGAMSKTDPTIIGGDPKRPAMAFYGVYHACRLYDRPLTPTEIALNAAIDAVRFRGVAPGEAALPDGYSFDGDGDLCVRVRAVALVGGRVSAEGATGVLTNDVPVKMHGGGTATFTAAADAGYEFVEWLGDLDAIVEGDAQTPTVTLAERESPVSVSARFRSGEARDPGTSAYVRNGLVMFFDGIDNAGPQTHSDVAAVWKDLSGNGNDGAVADGITWTKTGWSNDANGRPIALAQGGSGKAAAAAIANKAFTLEFTAKPSRDNVRQVFFGQYNGHGFNLEHNTGSVKDGRVRVYYSGSPDYSVSTLRVMAGERANVSLASEDDRQVVYKNGVMNYTSNTPITGQLDDDCACYVGGEPSRDYMAFYGEYNAFRLYGRTLTSHEIEQNALLDGARYQGRACTFWTKEGRGDWMDALGWTRGVPETGTAAAIVQPADSIAVDVTLPVPAATNLFLANERGLTTVDVRDGGALSLTRARLTVGPGSKLVVHEGGKVEIDETDGPGSGSDPCISAVDGGQILVDGGQMSIRGLSSSFVVPSGSEGCTGRITVASGSLDVTEVGQSARLRAHAGGRIEVCGDGRLNLSYAETSTSEASINYGGTLEISGNGMYTVSNRMAAANSGLVHLKDSGKLVINKSVGGDGNASCRLGLSPIDEPAVVTVDDDAEILFESGIGPMVYICNNHAGLKGVLNWNSSKTFAANTTLAVGFSNGEGVLNVTRGTVQGGSYGLRIAQTGSSPLAKASARGIANVSGGRLLNANSWQNTSSIQGLVVGAGVPAVLADPGFMYGTLNVSGGAVTNMPGGAGYFAVGVGYARGEVVQTGGSIANAHETYPTIIGAFGGTGEWIVSNGVSSSVCDVYLGGITTNDMPNRPTELYQVARIDAACATGTLAVVGGTFAAEKAIIAGRDGAAKIEVGPKGSLTAASADLANTEVSFTYGPEGVGTFDVAGNLSIGANVRLKVDASAYVGRKSLKRKIIGCASSAGDFAEITVTGPGTLRKAADGYWLDILRGFTVIVR